MTFNAYCDVWSQKPLVEWEQWSETTVDAPSWKAGYRRAMMELAIPVTLPWRVTLKRVA